MHNVLSQQINFVNKILLQSDVLVVISYHIGMSVCVRMKDQQGDCYF